MKPPRLRALRLEVLEDRTAPAVFVVNSLADGPVVDDGNLTLREAVTAATTNAASGDASAGETTPDLIVFAVAIRGGTINLTAGQLVLDGGGDLSIVGPGGGPSGITINGGGTGRVFNVTGSATQVRLMNLTITGGAITSTLAAPANGGGVLNQGPDTTLLNAIVTANQTTSSDFNGNGGGIANVGPDAQLVLEQSTVSGNTAEGDGGGIYNLDGTVTINLVRVISNQSIGGGNEERAGGYGGGVFSSGSGSQATITETTIAANEATYDGGGLYNGAVMTVRRSTVSENGAESGGGVVHELGTLNLVNTTLASNVAVFAGGLSVEGGTVNVVQGTIARNVGLEGTGGIVQFGGTINFTNSINSLNRADPFSEAPPDRETFQGTFNNNDSLEGGNPLLTPLQDNGGPTLTLAPLANNPSVIDQGDPALAVDPVTGAALTADQRGGSFPRQVGAGVDRGAVEFFAPATVTSLTTSAGNAFLSSQAVDLIASVSGSAGAPPPQGAVVFFDGATQLNAVPIAVDGTGTATLTGVTLSAGPHTLSARFSPANLAFGPGESSPLLVNVTPPTTTTTVAASPSGTSTALPVTFTATVDGPGEDAPTGTVNFFLGGLQLNAIPVPLDEGGTASFTAAGIPPGMSTVTAQFTPASGSGLDPSTGTVTVTGTPTDTIGVFDPTSGVWFLNNTNDNNPDGVEFNYVFGLPPWIPLAGDWDGDGTDTAGIVDPTTSTFFFRSANAGGAPTATAVTYGAPGTIPLAGDWDGGGGPTGIGVYDPLSSTFVLRNTPTAGPPDLVITFGVGGTGQIPVAGDWDGDGVDTVGLYDPGTGTWLLRATNNPTDGSAIGPFNFGTPGVTATGIPFSRPVVGDWDGDGTDTVGVYDTTLSLGQFRLRDSNTPGPATQNMGAPIVFGLPTWLPIAGNWGAAPLLQALTAAGGEGPGAPALGAGQLDSLVSAALARLGRQGLDPGVLNALAGATYGRADLPPGVLGMADLAGNRVLINADAAGWGWFVDPTPGEDSEFDSGAVGGMDLLSVLMHEMGHLAGRAHAGDGLMGEALLPGVRHLDALDALFGAGVSL